MPAPRSKRGAAPASHFERPVHSNQDIGALPVNSARRRRFRPLALCLEIRRALADSWRLRSTARYRSAVQVYRLHGRNGIGRRTAFRRGRSHPRQIRDRNRATCRRSRSGCTTRGADRQTFSKVTSDANHCSRRDLAGRGHCQSGVVVAPRCASRSNFDPETGLQQ